MIYKHNGSIITDIMMLKVNPEDTYIDLVSASNPTNNYYSIRLIKDT